MDLCFSKRELSWLDDLMPESKKKKKSSKGDLAVSGEEFESIESDFKSSISNIGESIYSGNIPKTPSEDACRFCTMRDSCTSAAK